MTSIHVLGYTQLSAAWVHTWCYAIVHLQAEWGLSKQDYMLLCGYHELHHTYTVQVAEALMVSEGKACAHLVPRTPAGGTSFNLAVKTLTGSTVTVPVNRSKVVLALKVRYIMRYPS